MEKVMLNELDPENTFFHFSPEKEGEFVEKEGLVAKIGKNSEVGGEKIPKVFFSKGVNGVLEACEVWIKWMMNNAYNINDRYGFYHGKSLEERELLVEKWNQKFLNREYLIDYDNQKDVFELVYQGLQRQVYYKLDLEEGIDFDYEDVDELKVMAQKKKEANDFSSYIYQKEMYGSYSNMDSVIMDSWNMHTKSYHSIDREKISQVVDSSGKKDGLSIVQEIYEIYGKEKNWDILDRFITYTYDKRKENNDVVKLR